MEDWRKNNLSWDEKMQYVFDNNYLTDLTVKVSDGKATRSFNAHKLILSMSSDVLEEELRAECLRVPGEAVLNITAANPSAFEIFLKFIYCTNIQLKSIREASDVIKVSIKFNLGELTKICLEFVERNLSIHTYMECAEFARMYNLKYLKSRCSDMVRRNTKLILTEQNITNWNMDALIDILEQPALQIREIDLFYLIEKWIKSKNYNDQSNSSDIQNDIVYQQKFAGFRKKIRDNIIPKFCFLGMTAEEFTTGPLSSGLLEKNESLAILGHIVADQCDVPYPEGFTQHVRDIYTEPSKRIENKVKSSISDLEAQYKPASRSTATSPSTRSPSSTRTSSIPTTTKKEPNVHFKRPASATPPAKKEEKQEEKIKPFVKTNSPPKTTVKQHQRGHSGGQAKSILKPNRNHVLSNIAKFGRQKSTDNKKKSPLPNNDGPPDLADMEKMLASVLQCETDPQKIETKKKKKIKY